jgi:hypothetical protein
MFLRALAPGQMLHALVIGDLGSARVVDENGDVPWNK